MNLDNKVVVVSGAASGLGWGAVQYCLRRNDMKVVLLDRDEDLLNQKMQGLPAERVFAVAADLTSESQVASAIKLAKARFGSIDACFSFAGVVGPMRILDNQQAASNCASFANTVAINLVGTFNLLAHCAQQMALNEPNEDGERGVVVTISSGAAFDGQVGQSAYSSSKAGLVGLSLPAARELAQLGIRVNSVAPGAFRTPMLESLPQKVFDRIAADFQFPKRFGTADEIAGLCCYIAENAYVNGECIRLDGAFRLPPR